MSDSPQRQIKIFYTKSSEYRTIHADGLWAGISPKGEIQIAAFNDLRAMPDYTVNVLTPEGRIGDMVDNLERDGITRETEVMLVLSAENTALMIELLQTLLAEIAKSKASDVRG